MQRVRAAVDVPLLVTNLVNVRYLTGFRSSNAAVLVEPERVRLFADFRYAEAGEQVEGVEFELTKRALPSDLAQRLSGCIAFEAETLTHAHGQTLRAGGLELVPTNGLVEGLRAVKDEDEIEAIRRATDVTNRAFERLAHEPVIGVTERELAWRMDTFLHEGGADANAFPTIVAAGANGASPHTSPGDRVIERGQTVIVDAGAIVDGYCSDCTRTFAAGELSGELADGYELCLRAQLAGLEAVQPGVSGVDADRAAREVVEAAGHGEHFGHGLGHGVGLDVHELPRLSTESTETVAECNVTSVEPGIYLPGLGGIRIEDLVVVRQDGPEVLTSFTKELVTLD
ncbi:MAG: M24 family metallopeptidase [Gaiellaceae bacterium]